MSSIKITGANEGILKNISLEIPKNKLVVFTGLSGSGKSTLLIDVLFNECQRQYLEAMSFQGIRKPEVGQIKGASPAIVISQTDVNKNPRSTVGTLTDIYTDLRMIYEKLGIRACPYCGAHISASDCREETEKKNNDFYVYMYCCNCGKKMDKLTRSHFSFNTREGACPSCEGLGKVHTIVKEAVVKETLSLEEGAVLYWEKQYGAYQISILNKAFRHYGLPVPGKLPVAQFTDLQKELLYHGVGSPGIRSSFPDIAAPKTAAAGRFEGVLPILWRRFTDKHGDNGHLDPYFKSAACPQCSGERLNGESRAVTVNQTRLPELSFYSLEKLSLWLQELRSSLSPQHMEFVESYLLDVETKLSRFLKAGLGYLSLDRQVITLSGGELQRIRLAAVLDSELSGIIYILDEPTAGLHPKDTAGLMELLHKLRDLGNTVLIIEHDPDVMALSDYIIDMGPGSGKFGGEITASGTLEQIRQNKASVTGNYLAAPQPAKDRFRSPSGFLSIEHAVKYNLRDLSVKIPCGCLVSVTGPSGSGKSTLIFEVLAHDKTLTEAGHITGLEQFDQIVRIGQSPITRMRRSNVATYSEVYAEIRNLFARTNTAKQTGLTAKHFSFNTSGGRCENCEGLGYVDNNMLFFANTEVVCPVCHGNQFKPEILSVTYKGTSIKDILNASVDEASDIFSDSPKISRTLKLLQDVGLGYLMLGQQLNTLSGGECQRLKLAKELIGVRSGRRCLYLLDEPTTGLHPKDIEHFLVLLDRLIDSGSSVIVVEHNQQVIRSSDWIIDLGPEGGERGGAVIFQGTPEELKLCGSSVTAAYL